MDKPFSKINLSGIQSWSAHLQKNIKDLLTEDGSQLALDDLDLGRSSVVKHKMKLTTLLSIKGIGTYHPSVQ